MDAGHHVDQATYRVPAGQPYAGSPILRSPSGKIACGNVAGGLGQPIDFLICGVFALAPPNPAISPPNAPASFPGLPVSAECQAAHDDYGADWAPNFVTMSGSGVKRGICPSQIVLPPGGPVLAYGSTVDYNGFACRMESEGLTCVNPSGKGFFMSASAYRAFG